MQFIKNILHCLYEFIYFPRTLCQLREQEKKNATLSKRLLKNLDQVSERLDGKLQALDEKSELIKRLLIVQAVAPHIVKQFSSDATSNLDPTSARKLYRLRQENKAWIDAIAEELMHLSSSHISQSYHETLQLAKQAKEITIQHKAVFCIDLMFFWFRFRFISDDFDILDICDEFCSYNNWHIDTSFGWALCIYALLENGKKNEALDLLKKHNDIFRLQNINRILPLSVFAHQNGFTNNFINDAYELNKIFYKSINTNSMLEALSGKTIAIVGNGPQQIGRNTGEEIDRHDIVVRFNDYNIDDKYVCDYGKKTDIWSHSLWATVNPKYIDRTKYVYAAEGIWNVEYPHSEASFLIECANRYNKIILCRSREDIVKFHREIKLLYPSNGLLLLHFIKSIYPLFTREHIYGFTYNSDVISQHSDIHYYEHLDCGYNAHDFQSEADIIRKIFN